MQIKLCMNEKKMQNNKELPEVQKIDHGSIVLCVSMQISVYDTWECRGLNNAFD